HRADRRRSGGADRRRGAGHPRRRRNRAAGADRGAGRPMTALKGRDIEAFLARPDSSAGLILVYGPDTGLVGENAARLSKHFAGDPPDPESLVQLHMSEIDADPQRLGIVARSPSLFGAGTTIRIRAATNRLAPTLAELLDEKPPCVFIVEG